MKSVKLLSFFAFLASSGLTYPSGTIQVGLDVGEQAPDFELQDSAGQTYKLSDFRGERAVVLEFFRSGDW